MKNSFIIDQVSWHTSIPDNAETRDQIFRRFYTIAKFLDSNGLTARKLIHPQSQIDDGFRISSDDLSDDGLSVMKIAYDKWLSNVDEGMSPEDLTLLEKALKRVKDI